MLDFKVDWVKERTSVVVTISRIIRTGSCSEIHRGELVKFACAVTEGAYAGNTSRASPQNVTPITTVFPRLCDEDQYAL